MRPKDLKPFTLPGERKIVVQDRIWQVPVVENDPFHFNGFSADPFFNNQHPVHLEFCSGNGLWISEKAKENYLINWVGIEIKWKRIKKIWSKIQNFQLPNLIGVYSEALYVTEKFFKNESVDKIYINFPDPWPKNRHSKYRLVQPPFISQCARVLKNRGELCIVTDDQSYSNQIVQQLMESGLFDPAAPAPHYLTELEGYGTSYFEELWRAKEKEIRYHIFTKK